MDALEPKYTEDESPRRVVNARQSRHRSNVFRVFAAGLIVGLIGLGGVAFRSSDRSAVPRVDEQTTNAAQAPTPAQVDEAKAKLDQQMKSGWIPFSGAEVAVPGATSPNDAWVRSTIDDAARTEGRQPVYNSPNGNVVGYVYFNLGYVPQAVADSGQFDARAARIQKFGCDISEPTCNSEKGKARYAEITSQHSAPPSTR